MAQLIEAGPHPINATYLKKDLKIYSVYTALQSSIVDGIFKRFYFKVFVLTIPFCIIRTVH